MSSQPPHISQRFTKTKVKTARGRKISSTKWLQRQLNDPYVQAAQDKGYRSRAAFKLLEINAKFSLFKKGYKVLDLGSAPGGWSQIAVNLVGKNNVLALDILDMERLEGVNFIKKNFLEDDAEQSILNMSQGHKFNVVMSDMAANTTGDRETDHLRTANLVEAAFNFAIKVLKEGGVFVTKIFQGVLEKQIVQKIRHYFKEVKYFKPKSSRKDSVEIYIIAKGFTNAKENEF